MTIKETFDCIDSEDGDLTFVKLGDNSDKARLLGVCASTEDLHDLNLPKGKYLVLRAIEMVEVN